MQGRQHYMQSHAYLNGRLWGYGCVQYSFLRGLPVCACTPLTSSQLALPGRGGESGSGSVGGCGSRLIIQSYVERQKGKATQHSLPEQYY